MKHITINDYGQFLGITGERLVVQDKTSILGEYPLNRLATVTIAKQGVSFSSNLINAFSQRGIKLFVLDTHAQSVSCLHGSQHHAVSKLREYQFGFLQTPQAARLARQFVHGKLRNQRAVLLYFSKYHNAIILAETAESISSSIEQLKNDALLDHPSWRERLMGIEGQAASLYWKTLRTSGLFAKDFPGRTGRGASNVTNSALNYGYAILTGYVWNALINAGLEAYAGCLHVERPGKPSLVLDVMEEYRAWTVDRVVIKLREQLQGESALKPKHKKLLIDGVHETFARRYPTVAVR